MPKQGLLRIHGRGEVEVELLIAYLTDVSHAYESILVFEAVVDGMHRSFREFPLPWYPFGPGLGWSLAPRRAVRDVRDWPPTRAQVSSLVPLSEQLVLVAVRLSSPGFWDFLGTLNPFEVMRQYLNDRHERRKDREWRESAERRKLRLENLALENKVLSERVKLAKEMGATDRDLAPFLNALVYKPLVALDRYQDKEVIEYAELPPPSDRRDA